MMIKSRNFILNTQIYADVNTDEHKYINTKFEILNPKQIQNSNDKNPKQ